jgi:ubiquitin-protein ligase
MLTETRWQKEQELIATVFPEFRPFTSGFRFGFEGYLRGPRSGTIYHVIMEAERSAYPQWPPRIDIRPRIGIHWIGDGERRRLCLEREWRPARSTFANTLLAVVRYLSEHDPPPGGTLESEARPADGGAERNPGGDIWTVAQFLRSRMLF